MNSHRISRRIAYGLAGAGIASAIAVGGAANAAPMPAHPSKPAPSATAMVPGTKCTIAQVERALAKEDPALANRINSHPKAKARFENGLLMTKEQRQAKRAEFRKKHPNEAMVRKFLRDHGVARPEMQKNRAAVAKAKATCGQF
ncbi:hemophore-related protein [Gordonia sp. CPCC 205515]|uniref:hemophore-related protein n=1 Tax=Gordonia sp. CPCC 205515 TaxID=3140791 RepID=UPI003AF36131